METKKQDKAQWEVEADEKRAAVMYALDAAGIEYKAQYVGKTKRDDGLNIWECYQWLCTLHEKAWGKNKWVCTNTTTFDYFCGLAHTTKPKYGEPKPKAPHAADVLHSLLMDAEANTMSFRDWCGNYDQSQDSMKAFQMYQACCDCDEKLSKAGIHGKLREELQEILREY